MKEGSGEEDMTRRCLIDPRRLDRFDFGPHHPFKIYRLGLAFELMDALGLIDRPGVYTEDPHVMEKDFPVSPGIEQNRLFRTFDKTGKTPCSLHAGIVCVIVVKNGETHAAVIAQKHRPPPCSEK